MAASTGETPSMANIGIGVTIGSHSVRGVKIRRKGEGFIVQRVYQDRVNDETRPVAGRALEARGIKGAPATVGLSGRDVIIRYSHVPPVPEWRLRTLMKFEVEEVGSQSGGDVSADYRRLELPDPEGERGEETVLVALARNTYLDRQIRALDAGGIKLAGACPNSVALFNAFAVNATYTEDETCLLVNIGQENIDIAIEQGGELLFARNATPGGGSFTEAVAQAFSTSQSKAEQMKVAKGDVTPKGQARYPDSTSEKVANAIIGVAGQLANLIQSTLMIARAQAKLPDLKVDRVCLAGGGASLKGLDAYLKQAMGIPVVRLDPFEISDTSQLPDDERRMIEEAPHEFAVAMGLAQARLSPAAFRLSLLPAALKRRRDFMTKGIWAALAGVAAAGILGVIYTSRGAFAETAVEEAARVESRDSTLNRRWKAFAVDLARRQEAEVKHRALAEMAQPGALLAKTLDVVNGILADSREVYLKSLQLKVDDGANEFLYYKPKRGNQMGSAFEKVSRGGPHRRDAEIRLVGAISGTQRPDAIYQSFVQACQANDQGLLVRTEGGFRKSRRGDEDGTFELSFLLGTPIRRVTEDGGTAPSITLRDLRLDSAADPTELRGLQADGIAVVVERKSVDPEQWGELVRELTDQGAVASPDGD